MNSYLFAQFFIAITIFFWAFASCFPAWQQSTKSPVDDTMHNWTPYKNTPAEIIKLFLGRRLIFRTKKNNN